MGCSESDTPRYAESDKPSTDRELLLVLNEKIAVLTSKIDELRIDNVAKYAAFENKLNMIQNQHNKDFDTICKQHQQDIDSIKKWQYMELGALMILSAIITWVVTSGKLFG